MSGHLPVLIVGAGPTGLMMACALERYDIPFRIIDKNSAPTQGSNATWIQSRTLEILDLVGLKEAFLKEGNYCHAINLYADGAHLTKLTFDHLDSTYPFILMLPQRVTEQLLNQRLEASKIRVERPLELIRVDKKNQVMTAIVKHADGDTEMIPCDWLIACDGANSMVRTQSHLPFLGQDLPEQFMVADAQMSSFLSHNEIHVFFDKGTIFPGKGVLLAAFPWGSNQYRLTANLYLNQPRKIFTEQEVREVVAERSHGNYIVDNVSWISPFWIGSKLVENMRENSIFLAGDAAHIHSPVGGQGMNTGIQDAYNLAWKLALVIKGKTKLSLLDSYQEERYPVVHEVVKKTECYTNMILFDARFISKLRQFCRRIEQQPKKLSKKIGMMLTQLEVRYKKSSVIHYQTQATKKFFLPGERVPDVKINHTKYLYDYFRNTQHIVFLFTGSQAGESHKNKMQTLKTWLFKTYADLVVVYIVTTPKTHADWQEKETIFDEALKLHEHFHIKRTGIYLIRPDNYIAYCSKGLTFPGFEEFLKNYLIG